MLNLSGSLQGSLEEVDVSADSSCKDVSYSRAATGIQVA
jgi:hypothetical protein